MFSLKGCKRRNSMVFVVLCGCFFVFVFAQITVLFGRKQNNLFNFQWEQSPRPQPYISFLASVLTHDARLIEKDCMWILQGNRTFMTKLENLLKNTDRTDELILHLETEMTNCISVVEPNNTLEETDEFEDLDWNRHENENWSPKLRIVTSSPEKMCLTDKSKLDQVVPMHLSDDPPTFAEIAKIFAMLEVGGYHPGPKFCKPRHSTAIIIPYRDRNTHLRHWLHYTLGILLEQQLEFTVFVVEQEGNDVFNKGQLMNTAFMWALQQSRAKFKCFVFHDVDMIPEVPGNFYTCADGKTVTHLSPYIDKFNYTANKKNGLTVGGAVAFTEWQYRAVNGYSNVYWGWGGEDDDMNLRIKHAGLHRTRPDSTFGRYRMIPHSHDNGNPINKIRHKLLKEASVRMATDGLSDLDTKVVGVSLYATYTHIMVRLKVPQLPWLETTVASQTSESTVAPIQETPISYTVKKRSEIVAKKTEKIENY
nr:beta-1,4-N-acetylgalactosaminyltransferase bre-4-like [Ciona intestinalis]|eukprot:XP_002130170.1 beta-1,4-N-acetylgalactosaminyltransferase bre-4-like [Ciona intestinalis]